MSQAQGAGEESGAKAQVESIYMTRNCPSGSGHNKISVCLCEGAKLLGLQTGGSSMACILAGMLLVRARNM